MEAFYAADAVFLGAVVEIGTDSGIECLQVAGCRDPDPDPAANSFAARVIVGFRVETSLKGGGDEAAGIEVATHHQSGMCGYMFQVGRSYLVYAADRDEDGRLSTHLCTRTRPVEDAAFDIEILSR